MTCCAKKRENFFFFWEAWLFAVGESWDGEEEGEIWEQMVGKVVISIVFLELTNRIFLSTLLTVNRSCHCTKIPDWIPRWFRWQFERWIGHITVRSCHFESSVIPSVKSHAKTSTSVNHLFFLILNISYVIPSVNTDWISPPVYTDGITDGKHSTGNGDRKLPTEVFYR